MKSQKRPTQPADDFVKKSVRVTASNSLQILIDIFTKQLPCFWRLAQKNEWLTQLYIPSREILILKSVIGKQYVR